MFLLLIVLKSPMRIYSSLECFCKNEYNSFQNCSSYLGGIDGMSAGAVFSATAISAGIATLCMAFFANYPVALASGMGLNAFFAFTVCGAMGYSYKVSYLCCFHYSNSERLL